MKMLIAGRDGEWSILFMMPRLRSSRVFRCLADGVAGWRRNPEQKKRVGKPTRCEFRKMNALLVEMIWRFTKKIGISILQNQQRNLGHKFYHLMTT